MSDPKQKQIVVNELLPEIAHIPFAVERDHWLRELSIRLGVEMSVLREDVERVKKQAALNTPRLQDNSGKEVVSPKKIVKTHSDLLIEQIFALVFIFPSLAKDFFLHVSAEFLSTDQYKALYDNMKRQYTNYNSIDINKLREEFADKIHRHEESLVESLLLQSEWAFSDIDEQEAKQDLLKAIERLTADSKKKKISELERQIQEAEKRKDKEEIEKLLKEFNNII